MDILHGLTPTQIEIVHRCRNYREIEEGEIIFSEGDPADSMFIIMSGAVEIFRKKDGHEYTVARLISPEVFGEMGLLTKAGRTASARALQRSLLFEVPNNLVYVMKEFTGSEATMKLVENLICILGERLRQANDGISFVPASTIFQNREIVRNETQAAMQTIERNLPKGLSKKYAPQETLSEGEFLCREGDPSDGFYFIHQGELEVLRTQTGGEARPISIIKGPTITGELGFFTKRPRVAGLRAKTTVKYTPFSGLHFMKIKQSDPDEAMRVLFAAARMAVYLIVKGSNTDAAH